MNLPSYSVPFMQQFISCDMFYLPTQPQWCLVHLPSAQEDSSTCGPGVGILGIARRLSHMLVRSSISIVDINIVLKEIGSGQIPKSMIAVLGKMPGSDGNHGQTAEHRQYFVSVAGWEAPSCDAVRHKCSVKHSSCEVHFTGPGAET